MKTFSIIAIVLVGCLSGLPGCKKNVGNNDWPPPVNDTMVARKFQIVIMSLPQQIDISDSLSAIISIANERNEVIVSDRKVALFNNGKYSSDTLVLAKGNYKLIKFWILSPPGHVSFATPISGSTKADLVTKPLVVPFALTQSKHRQIEVEVAKVNVTDKAEDFGYPIGSFGSSTPPDDPNGKIRIRVHPLIRIGDVVYDSIPVTLNLLTWNNDGQVTTTIHQLLPGINDLLLSKKATKFQLKISKWGSQDEITLSRDEVKEGILYSLGGHLPARKIREVLNYKLVNGLYLPETRDIYNYEAGQLKEILRYKKKADGSNYLAETKKAEFSNGKVASVKLYNETSALVETISFTYQQDGKFKEIVNTRGGDQTRATIEYTPLPGGTGITGNHNITVHYTYSFLPHNTYYVMYMQGGMMLRSSLSTSHGNNETAHFQYDYNINPFVHLNLPDLYLSQYSKHNKVGEQHTYFGKYPLAAPYDFSYSYNGAGYPEQLVTKYKNYLTCEHSATIKTVYKYY